MDNVININKELLRRKPARLECQCGNVAFFIMTDGTMFCPVCERVSDIGVNLD